MSDAALLLEGVQRGFGTGATRLEVLRGCDLRVDPGQLVALVGPSGSGKSTLLQIAGLLERADGGRVVIGGRDCSAMNDTARTATRRVTVGFVYQFHHLLPEFSAVENVAIPQRLAGASRKDAEARARDLLTGLGLGERLDHRPAELSGGEQQRVAIVRAVANRPRLLLADEPTGNLDPATADRVFAAFLELARSEGVGALIATHNPELARRMDRAITLREGRVVELHRKGETA